MAKYMLARGQTRLPLDGIRETKRANDKPLRTTETVLFSPNKVVESDLDFGVWVKEGVLICLDVRPTPKPDPKPAAAPAMILPTPIPAQVEIIREVPKAEVAPPVAESHLTTHPKPAPVEEAETIAPTLAAEAVLDRAIESIKYEDEPAPVEAPKAAPPAIEEKEEKSNADATKQIARGNNRNKRRH